MYFRREASFCGPSNQCHFIFTYSHTCMTEQSKLVRGREGEEKEREREKREREGGREGEEEKGRERKEYF
jgi:hypothetical protein